MIAASITTIISDELLKLSLGFDVILWHLGQALAIASF